MFKTRRRSHLHSKCKPRKLVDKFTYPDRNIASTESVVSINLAKAWTAIDRSSIKWKSALCNKIKCAFLQVVTVNTTV